MSEHADGQERYRPRQDYLGYTITQADYPLMGTTRAANALGCSAQTVRRRIEAGRLPSVRRGKDLQVPQWAVMGLRKLESVGSGTTVSEIEGLREETQALRLVQSIRAQVDDYLDMARQLNAEAEQKRLLADEATRKAISLMRGALESTTVPASTRGLQH